MNTSDRRPRRHRSGPIRHGRQRTPSPVGAILKGLAVVLAVALVSIGSVAAYAINSLAQQVTANAVDLGGGTDAAPPPPPVLGAFEGGFNLLVVGTDNDPNQGDSFGERDATLNDVNILLHVSADHKNAVVVSFPRDLVISHPECTDPDTGEVFDAMSAQPLNDAWERGGLACVNSTIENLTGLDINYAAATSFDGVIEMTNAVGGVPVCLNEPIFDADSGLDLPAGTSVIEGQMALSFLRNRHGVGDGSDLARIASQQQYLSSMARTLKSANTLTDITKLYGLAQAAASNIKLSTSLSSLDSMVSLALTMKDVDLNNIVFVQYPSGSSSADPNKVVPVQDLADELFAKVQADQPFTLADDSTGTGSTVVPTDPATPADPGTETPATDAPATDAPATNAPVEAAPEVIDGLKGQTAAEQTCASAFSD
ncbi:LCP family protein [Herbiconiux ginsengi]|uniref:Transcriptional attenuator, LytR family n=1 Tax=Herbiconiux ginsengi TaxID=381665 RepID=A0A1H3MHP4_9MICO|nr:LCP family protein [Herbiconiux ginsengi]SDY76227.1 transcriptional attenuator, LytR family [Herbiconiux ginsengi]